MGQRGVPVPVHGFIWRVMGSRAMGHASGDFPLEFASEGCRAIDVLELVEQLHHWFDYATYGAKYRLWRVRLLCSVLSAVTGLVSSHYVVAYRGTAYLRFRRTYFFVPETNGRTLEQMDHVFKDVSSEAEEERRARIEREIMQSERTGRF